MAAADEAIINKMITQTALRRSYREPREHGCVEPTPASIPLQIETDIGVGGQFFPKSNSCLAVYNGTAPSTFDPLNTSSGAELKRFANHAKIVESQPAKESGEQWRQLWHMYEASDLTFL